MNRRQFLGTSAAFLAYSALPVQADTGAWQKFKNPDTNSGLMLQPRWVTLKDRLTLVWAGTNAQARQSEVMYTTTRDGDNDWNRVKAPFFGNDLGRVRRIALATARDGMAMLFQRETTQGNGAVEVQLSMSWDNGFTFSNPIVMDSYVLGREGGSTVTIAARQGTRRPEFAAAWVAEDGVVRGANVDPRSGFRPQAAVLGNVTDIHGKIEAVGGGNDGFYIIFAESKSLKMARMRPLTGGVEAAVTVATGDFSRNFATTSYYRGPSFLTAATERGDFKTYELKDQKAKPLYTGKFPVPGPKLDSRLALEDEKHLHMAILDPAKPGKIFYMNNQSGAWSAPEVAIELSPDASPTGFDIAVTHNYAWVIVTQNQLVSIYRRKIR